MYQEAADSGNTAYYLGVQNNSTEQDASIVLRSGTITDGMKWKISKTVSGAYKLMPKTGEANNRVLAIENNLLYNNNGVKIRQRDYVQDDNFKDEWFITNSRYYATINSYYDNGYSVRYGESSATSSSNIKEYSDTIASRYFDLLGFSLTVNTPTYYNSAIDKCKGTVTTSNIDTICTHSGTIHTNRSSVIADFSAHYPGNDKTTSIFWSGHKILSTATNGNPDVNRSCSNGNCIFLIEISSEASRTRNSTGVLMHELNHQYGAKDHYHELADKNNPQSCKFKDICSECGNNPRPSSCIMYQSRIDINADTVICEACKEDIIKHLNSHHLLP